MAKPVTIYKLTILNLLDKVDFPLTNTQISDFFLEYGYTDYFHVQQTIHDLAEANLLNAGAFRNRTLYHLTDSGKETLNMLSEKLTDSIRSDTAAYLAKNSTSMRLANTLFSDYAKTPENDYAVHLELAEHGKSKIDLTITVAKQRQAKAICENWEKQNEAVYTYLMDLLMK